MRHHSWPPVPSTHLHGVHGAKVVDPHLSYMHLWALVHKQACRKDSDGDVQAVWRWVTQVPIGHTAE